jgi:hypothetical protein
MAGGLLQRIPDTSLLLQQRGSVQARAGSLSASLAALSRGEAGSALGPLVGALGQVQARLDIDVSGLTTRLPSALDTVRNALPPSALEFVESIEGGYGAARDFLRDSPLAQAVADGDAQRAGLAVIEEALSIFGSRLSELAGGIINPDALAAIAQTFADFERFRTNLPAHRDELLPFLAQNLVGVAPDLLEAPLGHLEAFYGALAPIEGGARAALAPRVAALEKAYVELLAAIDGLDPAAAAGYALVQTRLAALEVATDALLTALPPAYQGAQAALDNALWGTLFSAYRDLLDAVPLEQVPTLDDVVAALAEALGEILSRLGMVLGVEELAGRVETLTRTVRDTFVNSALGQVRSTLAGFLGDIRTAVEGVPTEVIQQTVEQLLGRVRQELESLGIDQVGDQIAAAFAEAEQFITTTINAQLVAQARAALAGLLSQLRGLPIAELFANLRGVLGQLQSLIDDIEREVGGALTSLEGLLGQLEDLSYEPLSDAVIAEIDALKAQLQQINPNALSDVEKLAIRGALAVLEEVDLSARIGGELKPAYHSLEGDVKHLLDELADLLARFREQLGIFDPEQLMAPVRDAFGQLGGALGQLNGRALATPLYAQVDALAARLNDLAPQRLLDPLQAPYDAMMGVVGRLDPAQWLEPLDELYAAIDSLISKIDVTPLFDELDRRQRQLFADARQAILGGLDALDLPEPLRGFLQQLRPFVEGLTDALFGDPSGELTRLSADLRTQLRLSNLFAPLDLAFDQLMELARSLPPADLDGAVNGIRQGLGVGLRALDPAAVIDRLRAAQGQLAALNPARLCGGALSLPALKLSFEARVAAAPPDRQGDIVALRARFDAVFALVAPGLEASRLDPLVQRHEALQGALRRRIVALDATGAGAAYARVHAQLGRLLPAFLTGGGGPLSHDEVLAGLESMRPSRKAAPLDALVEQFLAQVEPLADALADLTNGFFGALRDVLALVNPLALRGDVAAIYDAVRAKVRVLDPAALAQTIRDDLLAPLQAPLAAINPATIKARLADLFASLVRALTEGVRRILDDLAAALDETLRGIRAELEALLGQLRQATEETLGGVREVLERVENLVFVELLERLRRAIDNLGMSFDRELDRILAAFDAMLDAIPLDGAEAGVSVGI